MIDAAWTGALVEDFWLPELAGQRPLHLRPMQWYMDRVQRATHRSAYATNQFYRVINFLDATSKLFAPRMFSQALLSGFGTSQGNSVSPDTPFRQATHTSEAS